MTPVGPRPASGCRAFCIFLSYNSLFRGIKRCIKNPLACETVRLLRKTAWSFLKTLKIEPPCDPAAPQLGVSPRKSESSVSNSLVNGGKKHLETA